jgi:hypothetical protein
VHVHVDETRRDERVAGIDDFAVAGLEVLADLGDDTVAQAKIAQRVETLRRIDDASAANENLAHALPLTKKSRTAMRT